MEVSEQPEVSTGDWEWAGELVRRYSSHLGVRTLLPGLEAPLIGWARLFDFNKVLDEHALSRHHLYLVDDAQALVADWTVAGDDLWRALVRLSDDLSFKQRQALQELLGEIVVGVSGPQLTLFDLPDEEQCPSSLNEGA